MTSDLMDQLLPDPEFSETHHTEITATPADVWQALDAVEWSELGIVKFLISTRSLISRIRNGGESRDFPRDMPVLARSDGHEEVRGLVGRWWTFGAAANRGDVDSAEKFRAFSEPGYGKALFGFRVSPGTDGRTRLITETRVATTSPSAHRSMRRYWSIVRPFSGLLRRAVLAAVRRAAISR